jgi:hypothetical protein
MPLIANNAAIYLLAKHSTICSSTTFIAGRGNQIQENRCICVASNNRTRFLPDEITLTVLLCQAGLPMNMCEIGGTHIQECVAVGGHGERTFIWRLVTTTATAKAEMMEYFNFISARLTTFGLNVSDWTWKSR